VLSVVERVPNVRDQARSRCCLRKRGADAHDRGRLTRGQSQENVCTGADGDTCDWPVRKQSTWWSGNKSESGARRHQSQGFTVQPYKFEISAAVCGQLLRWVPEGGSGSTRLATNLDACRPLGAVVPLPIGGKASVGFFDVNGNPIPRKNRRLRHAPHAREDA
jgi:hypothetical protein